MSAAAKLGPLMTHCFTRQSPASATARSGALSRACTVEVLRYSCTVARRCEETTGSSIRQSHINKHTVCERVTYIVALQPPYSVKGAK